MEIKSFVFNPFYENTYVLWDESNEALIMDPGCYENYEQAELSGFIQDQKLQIKAIVNTHCHIDHVLGNYAMKTIYDCPLWIPRGEAEIYRAVQAYAPQWGIQRYTEAAPDKLMEETEELTFGNTRLKSIFCPGHSPGHLVFLHEDEKKLIGGDVLFRESIGRTDLPGGDHETLIRYIRQHIYTLDESIEVFPGHGPTTTIGHEKAHNPFVKAE